MSDRSTTNVESGNRLFINSYYGDIFIGRYTVHSTYKILPFIEIITGKWMFFTRVIKIKRRKIYIDDLHPSKIKIGYSHVAAGPKVVYFTEENWLMLQMSRTI